MELEKETLKRWWLQTTGEAHYKSALDGLVKKDADAYNKLRKHTFELVADGVLVKVNTKKE